MKSIVKKKWGGSYCMRQDLTNPKNSRAPSHQETRHTRSIDMLRCDVEFASGSALAQDFKAYCHTATRNGRPSLNYTTTKNKLSQTTSKSLDRTFFTFEKLIMLQQFLRNTWRALFVCPPHPSLRFPSFFWAGN